MCLLALAVLFSAPLGWAQGGTVYSCSCLTAPSLDGVLAPGEWNSTCGYSLQLHGVPQNVTDEFGGWHLEYPPAQSMQLYVMRDSQNVYLGFQWSHTWSTDNGGDSSPDKYVLFLAFDFVHDGIWQDVDNNPNTIDDGLGLAYLGFNIGDPNPPSDAWIRIYIPAGQYVFSWDAGEGQPAAIGGPPDQPGTIYHGVPGSPSDASGNPVTFNYGAARSPSGETIGQTYTYTIEVAVPKVLFHSPAGFGFGLSQETGTQMYWWTWPSSIDESYHPNDETGASILGVLTDLTGSPIGLDPEQDPPNALPVGGVTMPIDTFALILPWLALISLLGTFSAAVLARRRRL